MTFVFIVMVVCGVVGGSARYAAYLYDTRAKATFVDWCYYALLGLVAASIIPLFLEIVSIGANKGLVSKLLTSPDPERDVNALILVGFCLLAGFFSRNFIQSVADQTIRKADQASSDASQAISDARQAAQEATTAAKEAKEATTASVAAMERATEAGESVLDIAERVKGPDQPINARELTVMKAMIESGYPRPWPETVAEITGMAVGDVKPVLHDLEAKGFVQQRASKEGRERWRVRSWGRIAIERQDAGEGV